MGEKSKRNSERPELAYSVEKLFSGDFKVDVEGRRPLARL